MDPRPQFTPTMLEVPEQFKDRTGSVYKGENVNVRPGVLDTDSVKEPGVGERLMYSTILPRDANELHLDPSKAWEEASRLLAEATQKTIYANNLGRAHVDRANADWQRFQIEKRRLEREKSALASQKQSLESQNTSLKGELEATNDRLASQALLLSSNAAEIASLRAQLAESTAQRDHAIHEAAEDAVRRYRSSTACYAQKEKYAQIFAEYGFYMCRHMIEQSTGQTQPNLLFLNADVAVDLDIDSYDPRRQDFEGRMKESLIDDFANLSGPWSPFVVPSSPATVGLETVAAPAPPPPASSTHENEERIEALDGIEEVTTDFIFKEFDGPDPPPAAQDFVAASELPISQDSAPSVDPPALQPPESSQA